MSNLMKPLKEEEFYFVESEYKENTWYCFRHIMKNTYVEIQVNIRGEEAHGIYALSHREIAYFYQNIAPELNPKNAKK